MADRVTSTSAVADRADRIAGVVLGTAVGDALGLPREGLSRGRGRRLFGGPPLRHRFLFGRGMVSDDTKHTCMAGQALLRAPADAGAFARSLAWRLRLWLLGLPAGTGRATLRAVVKLWLGFPPTHSGVRSAGNGPAMRAALLGACLAGDRDRVRAYVRASTRLTHTDPRAERGALLVALAAGHGATCGPGGTRAEAFLREVRDAVPDRDPELERLLGELDEHLRRGAPAAELADALGLRRRVSGYVYHTVPLALHCWLRQPGDFRRAVEEVIGLGGDADSTGAVGGGVAGATVGAGGTPQEWVEGLFEWPRSTAWMRRWRRASPTSSLSAVARGGGGRCRCSGPAWCRGTCYSWPSSWRTACAACCRPTEAQAEATRGEREAARVAQLCVRAAWYRSRGEPGVELSCSKRSRQQQKWWVTQTRSGGFRVIWYATSRATPSAAFLSARPGPGGRRAWGPGSRRPFTTGGPSTAYPFWPMPGGSGLH